MIAGEALCSAHGITKYSGLNRRIFICYRDDKHFMI
jgi:hypothetical protein